MTAFRALADTLGRLADAIRPLTVDEYSARDSKSSGSIGAHVRHCLDHVSALECGVVSGHICYDNRERNMVVERDPRLGVSRLRRASARLSHYPDGLLERALVLTTQIADDGRSIRVDSSVGRELAFVISHTIHHSALIAVLLERSEHDVPARLGLAPSTPALACAQ